MLRRHSTKRKRPQTLPRSKSASSIVHGKESQLDAIHGVGERDARIAARISFERFYGRHTQGMAPWYYHQSEQVEGNQWTAHQSFPRQTAAMQDGPDGLQGLRRQKSIRFAGPDGRPRKHLAGRASGRSLRPMSTDPRKNIRDGSVISEDCMSSYDSQTLDRIRELRVSDGYCTLEDDSDPVPYSRLRKSRSLYETSDSQFKSGYYSNGPNRQESPVPLSLLHSNVGKENRPLQASTNQGLRAPKSMSFLRGRHENTMSHTVSRLGLGIDETATMDECREAASRSELKSQPSMLFRSKMRRTDGSLGLRKSLRTSSNNSTALSSAFSGDSLAVPKGGSLRAKARKVSSTLKTRMKGFFGRQKSSFGSSSEINGQYQLRNTDESFPSPVIAAESEGATVSRGPSRIAMLQAVDSHHQVESRQGSLESVDQHSNTDDKSRVTSWTDSVTNTVLSQPTQVDWDCQRLPVIRERGAHSSSPAPLEDSTGQDTVTSQLGSLDSQRVYSALIKRANEIQMRQAKEREENMHGIKAHGKAPPRSSSIDQVRSGDYSPPTIRCVRDDNDVFQDNKSAARESAGTTKSNPRTRPRISYSLTSSEGSPNPWSGKASDSPGKASFVTHRDADHPTACERRMSTFFASPTSHMFRTTSPFRKALQSNLAAAAADDDTEYLGSMSAVSLPPRHRTPEKSEMNDHDSCAGSVYSSDAKGCSPVSRAPTDDHGMAVIYLQDRKRSPQPSPIREVSHASSVEWKTWLSSHASKLDEPVNHTSSKLWTANEPQISPRVGHVREWAEIDSSGDFAQSPSYAAGSSTEITPVRAVVDKPSGEAALGRRMDDTENKAPTGGEDTGALKPPIPVRSSLRMAPSMPALTASNLRTATSGNYATLRPTASLQAMSMNSASRREEALLKRRARMEGRAGASSTHSSPGLTAAVERQFGRVVVDTPPRSYRKDIAGENVPPSARSGTEHSGSKVMVEQFLSSRRQRVAGSTADSTMGSSPAFL
ncbi:uncharacterized protein F5Z01DRAFT_690748 [Emericellopsis atlantica]|uniref:Uncharacterized protein n=1 Tax=Emericellopsis atlantica TaxID=2614577 RepID=A0A9P7ZJ90_9HYPO|nr:uncharacterized protein F5Z01DRAFT_690748 [Emericellopsis atlantica]KAG9252498.1 hypothetical protein F5Z01DRAFT_690748 [Emericellopsis atlantica]